MKNRTYTDRRRRGLLRSVLLLLLGAHAALSNAQDADNPAPSESDSSTEGQLQTVIITATQRAEDIKDIPTSTTPSFSSWRRTVSSRRSHGEVMH